MVNLTIFNGCIMCQYYIFSIFRNHFLFFQMHHTHGSKKCFFLGKDILNMTDFSRVNRLRSSLLPRSGRGGSLRGDVPPSDAELFEKFRSNWRHFLDHFYQISTVYMLVNLLQPADLGHENQQDYTLYRNKTMLTLPYVGIFAIFLLMPLNSWCFETIIDEFTPVRNDVYM